MSEETNGAANGAASSAGRLDGGRIDGIHIPKGATHWRCVRFTKEGQSRLAFGVVEATGEQLLEAPISEFSIQTMRTLWGDGDFRVFFTARDSEGRNPSARGKTDLIRFGAVAPELVHGASSKPGAGRFCEACGAGMAPASRFCASCGVAAGGAAAPPPAPLNREDPLSFALAFQNAFTAGQTSALALVQQVTQQVATHEEARTKRYQADVQERIERDRHAHERAMKEQEAFYQRTATPPLDADALMKPLRAELKAINAKVEEALEAGEEEEEEEEPIGEPSEGTSTFAGNVSALTAAAEKAGPMIGSALTGAVDMYTKLRGTNGAASAGS